MNSPPEPGSPSLSTPSSATPPEELFALDTSGQGNTSTLLNMVSGSLASPTASAKRRTYGSSSTARDSKSRRRDQSSRVMVGGSGGSWEKEGSARKEDMVDNSAVDFLRKEIGDPFLD